MMCPFSLPHAEGLLELLLPFLRAAEWPNLSFFAATLLGLV